MKKIQQYTKLTKNPKENLKKTNTKLKLKLKNKVNRNYLLVVHPDAKATTTIILKIKRAYFFNLIPPLILLYQLLLVIFCF